MDYYDIHCHVFNKDVVVRRLVNVVQALLTIEEVLESDLAEERLKYKVDGISKVLDDTLQQSSKDVFAILDDAYNHELIVTPLMFDLTYADDNDGDEKADKRYRKRIKRIFKVLYILLPLVNGKLEGSLTITLLCLK